MEKQNLSYEELLATLRRPIAVPDAEMLAQDVMARVEKAARRKSRMWVVRCVEWSASVAAAALLALLAGETFVPAPAATPAPASLAAYRPTEKWAALEAATDEERRAAIADFFSVEPPMMSRAEAAQWQAQRRLQH